MGCEHKNFDATVNVMRLGEEEKSIASVRIICKDCGVPASFVGLPDGISLERASCSALGTIAHLAFEMFKVEQSHLSETDFYGQGKKPDRPTQGLPGSEEKKTK